MDTEVDDVALHLEAMIDRHGLVHVLVGLELVCAEKAEHIATNWQDTRHAKLWADVSVKLHALAEKVRI